VTRRRWLGLGGIVLLLVGSMLAVHLISQWYSADWRAVRDCRATYFACTSTVVGSPRLDSLKGPAPTFEGHAKACQHNPAWERAIFRAKFECQVSRRVEHGTCRELETTCDITGSR
jgi:hypothetical protein